MTIDKKLWRNRRQRKELARRLRSEDPGLEVVHPHAAGVDVGNSAHYVAVRPDRDPEPVRRFECFTADLHRLADWLQSCGVKTVALQSTGVYWIPLYDILEERGFASQRKQRELSRWRVRSVVNVPLSRFLDTAIGHHSHRLRHAQVRVEGSADPVLLRVLFEIRGPSAGRNTPAKPLLESLRPWFEMTLPRLFESP
jgi:hypothetical protein